MSVKDGMSFGKLVSWKEISSKINVIEVSTQFEIQPCQLFTKGGGRLCVHGMTRKKSKQACRICKV